MNLFLTAKQKVFLHFWFALQKQKQKHRQKDIENTSMKNRLTSVDIRCIVAELRQKVISLRLANVYDMNRKNYLLKFAKPDSKVYVVVESGTRLHVTQFEREKNQFPNDFSMKLRRSLRTRRCEDVQQLGVDRVIDFTFGAGEACYHLIMEFYAKGNIVLTDGDYRIIAVLRTHKKEEATRIAVGETYPVESRKQFTRMTRESLQLALSEMAIASNATLKSALNTRFDYGAGFVEHCILKAGLEPNSKLAALPQHAENGGFDDALIDRLVEEFQHADDFIEKCHDEPQGGYIILRREREEKKQQQTQKQEQEISPEESNLTPEQREDLQKQKLYEDFTPFLFEQFKDREHVYVESFGDCVDKYFSAIESQQLDRRKTNLEKGYAKRFEKAKQEHQNRIRDLEREERTMQRRATLIQENVEYVDRAIEIINSAIAQSLDWDAIWDIILEQKQHGDVIANMLYKLKLDRNWITLLLQSKYEDEEDKDNGSDEEEEDSESDGELDSDSDENESAKKKRRDQGPKRGKKKKKKIHEKQVVIGDHGERLEKVDIDLSMTAFANATRYFEQMKKVQTKLEKTLEASERALKIAEKKSARSLEKNQITAEINLMRKRLWFEKFNWFISSENFLVISGRDAQQNELIVKRYMQKDDIYVHAEMHGSASCVIKNPTGKPVPHLTLTEAGTMCVCRSSAWDAKIVTSAYWVYAHQVSKTAPTGEYLTTGSFMIRGKKNFLAPSQLIVGLGVLFRVDESCIANHIGERRPRDETEDNNDLEADHQIEEMEKEEEEEDAPSTTILSKAMRRRQERERQRRRGQTANDDADEDKNQQVESEETRTQNVDTVVSKRSMRKKPAFESLIEEKLTGVNEGEEQQQQEKERKFKMSAKDRRRLKALERKGINRKEALEMLSQEQDIKEQANDDKHIPKEVSGDQQDKQESIEPRTISSNLLPSDTSVEDEAVTDGLEEMGGDIITPSGNASVVEQGKKRDVSKRQRRRQEQEEIAAIMEEENIKVLDDAVMQQINMELDSLTGQPLEDDIITFAIPVCAPYSTLKNYKYKVKLVPGTQRRGKAGQQAIGIILQEAKRGSSEKDFLAVKAISETEVTSAMIGSCRVSGGAQAPKNKNAKRKKKK